MKDDRKYKEYMTVLGELFDKPISELLISVYWKTLQPFDDELRAKKLSRRSLQQQNFSRNRQISWKSFEANKTTRRRVPGSRSSKPFAGSGITKALSLTILLSIPFLSFGADGP